MISVDDVRAALEGAWLAGAQSGPACIVSGDVAQGNDGLVSVAVVDGDLLTSVRARYPDGTDVDVDTGKGFWSSSVDTLWVLLDGPRTTMVSILGTNLAPDELQARARSLAALAIGRL